MFRPPAWVDEQLNTDWVSSAQLGVAEMGRGVRKENGIQHLRQSVRGPSGRYLKEGA